MSRGRRDPDRDLSRRLREEPYRFEFVQLIHLLQTAAAGPVRVGGEGPYQREVIRLRPSRSLAFSPADVLALEEWSSPELGDKIEVTVGFMGLYGASAPTPTYFSEVIAASDPDPEPGIEIEEVWPGRRRPPHPLLDLLDLFNHRLVSLFFRAAVKYRHAYRYRPEGGAAGLDGITRSVLAFVGLDDPQAGERVRLPVPRLSRYVGLLCQHSRPAVSLQKLLDDYFAGTPIAIRPWMLRWVRIPKESRSRLGAANSTLAKDMSVGERVPDRAGKFRVVVGPIGYDEYLSFLPGTRRFRELVDLVRLWVGERLEFDVELVLRRDEVPRLELGEEAAQARLGWTGWVTSGAGVDRDPRIVFASRHSVADGEGGADGEGAADREEAAA